MDSLFDPSISLCLSSNSVVRNGSEGVIELLERDHSVTVVIESPPLFQELRTECSLWNLPIDVHFFDSVTEALLELSSQKPDMIVVEMSMPRPQQEKTFQALENFNQRGNTPLSVVLITAEKDLKASMPEGASSSIQVVSGPMSAVWLHAYLTGVIASRRA